jgi:hypothetical protein
MVAPTYTYGFDPADSTLDATRLWLQDTGSALKAVSTASGGKQWYFADQEISYALTKFPNPVLAASWLAGLLAEKFAPLVDKSVGDLRIAYGKIAAQFLALSQQLRAQADSTDVTLYAGGISRSDMENVDANSDRNKPPFSIKQFNIPNSADAAQIPGEDCE